MIKQQMTSRDDLLTRRISQHIHQFHGAGSGTSRRTFLRNAALAAGLPFSSGILVRQAQGENDEKHPTALPRPIPGGVSPLGIFIHHFPVSPTAAPLQSLMEPSQITDFKGFVGLNRIRGAGMGAGFSTPLAFQADMGFMKGVYVGEDNKQHHATFCFI